MKKLNNFVGGIFMEVNDDKKLQRLFTPIESNPQQRMDYDFYNLMSQTINSQNAVCGSLNQMSTLMFQNNDLLLRNVHAMIADSERRHRNKKAKRVGCKLNASQGDCLKVEYLYDTGESQDHDLVNNLSGTFGVYKLKLKGLENLHMFAILFPNEGVIIVGDVTKVKVTYIYECFIRAGASFNVCVPRNIAAKVLHEFFAPLIEKANLEYQVSTFAGWDANHFQHAESFAWRNQMNSLPLTVLTKKFAYVKPSEDLFNAYFAKLNAIKEHHERALFAVLPFIGLLMSKLQKNENINPFFINLVILEHVGIKKIFDLLQVFNRDKLIPKSLDRSQKSLQELVRSSNDEIVIVNALSDETDTTYRCGKVYKNVAYLANAFLGKELVGNEDFEAGKVLLVTLTERRIFRADCINIFVTSETFLNGAFHPTPVEDDAVACVLSTFVNWAERNMAVLEQIVRKKRAETDGRKLLVDITQEIVELFLSGEGYSLMDELKLPAGHRVASIFEKDYKEDDLLKRFKSLVHHHIRQFRISNRFKVSDYSPTMIYIDQEYIFFPVKVFDRILGGEGILPYKKELLLELQKLEMLKRENDGIAKKVTLGGKTGDYYVIKQEFFEELGVRKITEYTEG